MVPCRGTIGLAQSQPFARKREALEKKYLCRSRALEKAIKGIVSEFYEHREYTLFADSMAQYGIPLDLVRPFIRSASS